MDKHDIKSFEITRDEKQSLLIGNAECSCGMPFTTSYPNSGYIADKNAVTSSLRALCDAHVGVVVEEVKPEPKPEKTGHQHSYAFQRKIREGNDSNSRWYVETMCACGKTNNFRVTPVGNDADEAPGDPGCEHQMVYNFEIQRNYDTKRPGWKQFSRCTKCPKTTWDIEYHYK